ncbi:hypothetical protein GJAV_G00210220 [Gymnothorax javanicus]|nr:hypothetical protein GJAV_G00210220 [Gymnothorax javanicus]
MFIDRTDSAHHACSAEVGSGVIPRPVNLTCFSDNSPQNSPSLLEPAHPSEYPLSRSASSSSQLGHIWSYASGKHTSNHLNRVKDGTAMGTMKLHPYVGVRVKHPVKDLIMKKRRNQRSWSSNYQTQDHTPCSDLYPDITTKILLTPEPMTGVPIATAQMCEAAPKARALHAHIPTETCMYPVYPTPNPADLPAAMEHGFYVPPPLPQPEPPPPSPPRPPLLAPSVKEASGISLFQWQIQHMEQKVGQLTPAELLAQDDDGDTFLHIAVAQGKRALSYALARNMAGLGALDAKDLNGQSALQVSVAANQNLIVQDLITLGAQINTVDLWGRSPLHVCAEKGYEVTLQAIHKALGETGQKVNTEAVNYEGLTALHTAVLSHNAVLKELTGEAVLHSAQIEVLQQRKRQLEDCIRTLLQMGASCRTKEHKSGHTSLHLAAAEANIRLLHLFLGQPDSLTIINDMAYSGNTALHVVSGLSGRAAQVDAVKLLMRSGADPSIRNLEKEQPSQLVPEGPVGDVVWRILKGKGVKSRPLPY